MKKPNIQQRKCSACHPLATDTLPLINSFVDHTDGLVYNYGNSVCDNFSGDAKNVLNFPKKGPIKLKLYVQVHRGQDV